MSRYGWPEGFYITCDDAVCTEHAPSDEEWSAAGGFEDWTEPLAIFADDESDSPTHCAECGVLIPHALTPEGFRAVAEAIAESLAAGERNPVTDQWRHEYGDDAADHGTEERRRQLARAADTFERFGMAAQADALDTLADGLAEAMLARFDALPLDPVWSDPDRPDLHKYVTHARTN